MSDEELQRAHERAVVASGLTLENIMRDVSVDSAGEHLLVSEVWRDAGGKIIAWHEGTLPTTEHVIPIDDQHPWWRDTTSMLPRFSG